MLIDLGAEAAFTNLPAPVSLGNMAYYLVRGEAGYQLISTVCPHMGGQVVDVGACFQCPNHGWRFEHATGRGIDTPSARLSSIEVRVQEGRLIADVPSPKMPAASPKRELRRPSQLTVQLHAHACLEIAHKGFSLLTDPWLWGPAFLGAWLHYPPTIAKSSNLRPDAIFVTHEHSDHFHEPTLAQFDRATHIYVPDFPNRRLVQRLEALGFPNLHPMSFGKPFQVSESVRLTCFEPGSLWNDSLVLIEVEDFRLLNINDAGLNRRIASHIGPVDAVASVFSPGASDYPITWSHLEADKKVEIMEYSRQGFLQMLKDAMALYGASYLIPFAGHFTLWHPSHRNYVQLMRRNTLDDVVKFFEGSDVQVIDLLPGESWNAATGQINRIWRHRERLYDLRKHTQYLERHFNEAEFNSYYPEPGHLTRDEVESYFLRLNETPEIVFCEDLKVRVRTTDAAQDTDNLDVSFEVAAGQLRILREPPATPNLSIEVPFGILRLIVKENLSWDEAKIGYWCRFSRSPNVYHAGFRRLLQAPYFKRPANPPPVGHTPIRASSVIADLIEIHGEQAERVLRRYGMYCAGCQHSTYDSIALGASHHGIEEKQVDRLVQELNQLFSTTPALQD